MRSPETDHFKNGKVLFDFKPLAENANGLPDGLKVHKSGNIFATGPGEFILSVRKESTWLKLKPARQPLIVLLTPVKSIYIHDNNGFADESENEVVTT
jgi:hypothetical protein